MQPEENYQPRWRSKILIPSLVSLLIVLLGDWGLYDKIGIEEDLIKKTIDFILILLGSFGVINSPDNKHTLWYNINNFNNVYFVLTKKKKWFLIF